MYKIIYLLAMLQAHGSYDTENVSRADIYCTAKAVYHEARGEAVMGQVAVAHVIRNRVRSSRYPDDACSVIYQPHQFSHIHEAELHNKRAWESAVEAATFTWLDMVDDPTEGATHYYAHSKVLPRWAKEGTKLVMGNHTFMRGVK